MCNPSRSSVGSRGGFGSLALWIGVWAIVIALIGLYLGIDARNVAADSERRMARNVELLDESRASIEALEAEIRESLRLSGQRLEDVEFLAEQNQSRVRTNSTQLSSTRNVAAELIQGLTSQKEAITELATRIPAIPENVQVQRSERNVQRSVPSESPSETQPTDDSATTTRAPEPTTQQVYTVKSGDTLVDIARRKNLSVPALLDANPAIDPNLIRVGQKLNLPE